MAERIMRRLSGGARTGVFLATIVIALVALFTPGWLGALLIGVIVVGLGTLMTKTWPVTASHTRVIRVAVLIGLVALAAYKATHGS